MSPDVRAVVEGLTGYEADILSGAWQGQSGRWYINAIPKDFYANNICRLTGVLTDHGIAVRQALREVDAIARGDHLSTGD